MKKIIQSFIVILVVMLVSHISAYSVNKPTTYKYAGVYKSGTTTKKGHVRTVRVYPESDSTILVYIEIITMDPGNNLGELFTRIKIIEGKGEFLRIDTTDENKIDSISFRFEFKKNKLLIDFQYYSCSSSDNINLFEFGGAHTHITGEYRQISKTPPTYFIDFEETKNYFSNPIQLEENKALK